MLEFGFPAAEEFVVVFEVFFINEAPNVLYRLKDLDCRQAHSAPGLFYYKSHAVVIAAVCGFALSC